MRDVEEFSIVQERVSLDKLKRIMYGGDMMLPSIITAQMGLNYLEEHGMLSPAGVGGGGGGVKDEGGGGVTDGGGVGGGGGDGQHE